MILPVAFLTGEILKPMQRKYKVQKSFFTMSCRLKKKKPLEKFHRYFKRDWNIFMLCLAQVFVKTILGSFDFWNSLSISILEQ